MIAVFLQFLALASVGLVAPASILLVILLLMSDYGWRNGVTFVVGYIVMYWAMGVGVLVFGGQLVENSTAEQSLLLAYFLIGLGLLFFVITAVNWIKRPDPNSDKPSLFARIVDGINPAGAFFLGSAVTVLNVKNLTIFLSAVSVLLLSDVPIGTQLIMLTVGVPYFCTTTMIPVAICLIFPDRSNEYLSQMKTWIDRNSRPLGIGITLFMSCYFLYLGISGM